MVSGIYKIDQVIEEGVASAPQAVIVEEEGSGRRRRRTKRGSRRSKKERGIEGHSRRRRRSRYYMAQVSTVMTGGCAGALDDARGDLINLAFLLYIHDS